MIAQFVDDAHVDGTVLYREVLDLGFDCSYVTFVRQLRLMGCARVARRTGPVGTVPVPVPVPLFAGALAGTAASLARPRRGAADCRLKKQLRRACRYWRVQLRGA